MFKNKKGDVGDFIVMLPIVFIIAISLFIGLKVWGEFDDKFQSLDIVQNSSAQVQINQSMQGMDNAFNIFDKMFIFFFFGFYLALLVSIGFLDTNRWFFIGFLILFGIIMFLGMVLSDVATEIVESDGLSSVITDAPATYHIMQYLPYYLFGMLVLFGIVLYGVGSRTS